MEERILSIEQAAKETPWGASTLYRWAPEPDSPFKKVRGRWVTTTSALIQAVEAGEKPVVHRTGSSPMPKPRSARRGSVLARIHELRREAA